MQSIETKKANEQKTREKARRDFLEWQQANKNAFDGKVLGESSTKTVKGEKYGYLTGICYMIPWKKFGTGNLCPFASNGCATACLEYSGHGTMSNTMKGRYRKTAFWYRNREGFFNQLIKDVKTLERKADREGKIPVVRLNGTSDIMWEKHPIKHGKNVFQLFPEIQFYDYTKNPYRFDREPQPKNYHITFSKSETNGEHVRHVLANKSWKVAAVATNASAKTIVFQGKKYRTVNGDNHDLRFLDKGGRFVLLQAKGLAKFDQTGFVIQNG